MCSTIKRFFPLLFVVSLAISSFGQSGNQGGFKTTNSMFSGALLITDGSKYYWGYPTNLQANATNAQFQHGTAALTNFNTGITNEVWWNSSTNIVTAFSNMVDGTRYHISADALWKVRANSVKSNGLAALNAFNKSNIEIIGHGGTIWATNIGDVILLTNCNNVELRGLVVKGTVVTNWVGLGPIGVVWGALGYYACSDLRLYNNRFIDHHDHGILDWASQGGLWRPATTNVIGAFNYLYNGGSYRTNESSSRDGTAIVPTGGTWTDNLIVSWLRGIEPYIENTSGSGIAQNTLVARNRIVNSMDDAILSAGSTNIHGVTYEDNIIEWHPGATWRGSNFMRSATAININGGQRVKILRNKIYNAPNFDISITGDLTKHGYVIKGNQGYGHFYQDAAGGAGGIQITTTAALWPNSGFDISDNFVENKRTYGLAIAGLRDSTVRDNTLLNTGTNAYTRALWVYTDGTISVSNVTIEGTYILNDERAAGAPSRGIDIEANAKAIRIINTKVDGIATKVNNGAGTQVITWNHDSTDTNQVARKSDVKDMLAAGSNITLTPDANGVTTIASSGGGGGGGAGSLPANANQFSTNTTLTFISGALTTNLNARGITIPQLTTDRALYVNGSGNVTNSPNVTATELEYLDGLTAPLSISLSNQVRVAAGTGGITVTPSGSGGVMTYTISDDDAGSGGGGTNFPNVNLLLGATNVPIVAGIESASHQQTNASYILNISQSGAFVSGQIVTHSVSNYGTSDITVTVNTNSVAANPYDIATKTNVNTFTASASAITKIRLTYTANGLWLLDQVAGPTAIQKFGPGIITDTNGVNGLDITVSTKRLTNYAHAATITINGATDVDMTVTNDLSAGATYTIATPTIGSSGVVRFRPDSSARTVAFQTWPAAIVPLSTNRFSNVTNIDLAASKWAYWNYDIARGTNGTTNCFVWVIQAP